MGLAVLCLPALTAGSLPSGAVSWTLVAAREVLVGVVMGFVCACMFRAPEVAGELTDILRGANPDGVSSPAGDGRTSPLGALMLLLAIVVFLEIGGIGHVVSALGRSYEAIPLAVAVPLGGPAHAAAFVAIVASGRLIEAAIGLAAPAVVAMLLADILLGVIGRAVPRVPIQFGGMPLKALLGLGTVLLGLGGMDMALQGGFRGFLEILQAASRLGR